MKKYLIFILFLLISIDAIAQGFNSSNGRNHPYLNWQVAETEHFEIIYPDHLEELVPLLAAISEESYSALSQNLEVVLTKRIRLYFSDEDEISNGFANPIGKGYSMMWVNVNDYAEIWTGNEKWLRKLIAHELAHIFHFNAVWTNMGLLQYAFSNPLPRFWAEGLAQYQTEYWDSQRGDRWLRKAIFDSRPNFNDGQSLENRRLQYASGNSQLRYFTDTYGDSSLVNMLLHRKNFLGLFEVHDFDSAFKTILDGGYPEFYEEWRKHMNVYYNTLASQMERTDSLFTDTFSLPGQFYFDMAVSPDDSLIAVLSIPSLQRSVRSLYIVQNNADATPEKVAEGSINSDLTWGPNGTKIYYSRIVRGERSSLVNDIFVYDTETGRESQITFSRKARYPTAGPGSETIAYVVNEDGTANIFTYNVVSNEERKITRYAGDHQILHPLWIEREQSWLYHLFDEEGNRFAILYNPETNDKRALDERSVDNRKFIISPNGNQVAYTSLRDEVPNVFVYDFRTRSESRVTNLFTGGEVYGWITETDSLQTEKLLVKASETKRRDYAYWVNPTREFYMGDYEMPQAYSQWRKKQPPVMLPSIIPSNAELIHDQYKYRPLKNLTHASTLMLPYYSNRENWGLFGTTAWTEPLGKHIFAASGLVSFGDFDNIYGVASYINNLLYPTLATSIYRMPGNAHFYGSRFLVEELTGGDVTMNLPVDAFEAPYRNGSVIARLRHVLVKPYELENFSDTFVIPAPERARQTDLTVGFALKKQRPWVDNLIHPLDGWGIRALITGSEKVLGSDVQFLTADLSAYSVLPSIGRDRIYMYGRFQQQWGAPLPQNFIGFSRIDNIKIPLPGQVPLDLFDQAERVRGYRSFVAGDRVAFASLEYRMPFIASLETKILGVVDFGTTTLSLFTDAGVVWNARIDDDVTGTEERWGAGAELKNQISLFGINFIHALGIAQPALDLFTNEDYDLYYRARAVIPF